MKNKTKLVLKLFFLLFAIFCYSFKAYSTDIATYSCPNNSNPKQDIIWDDLKNNLLNIKNTDITVERALCEFPQVSTSILMVQSRSIQKSTAIGPRAIFFNSKRSIFDGKSNGDINLNYLDESLIYTITHKKYSGGDRIELMRKLPFSLTDPILEMIDIDLSKDMKIHEGTPVRCQKCHGTEPRILWGEIDFWPAASLGEAKHRTDEEFEMTKKSISSLQRYFMINTNNMSITRGDLRSMDKLASEINSQRLVKKIFESPNYINYKYAILGSAIGCQNIVDFLPSDIQQYHQNLDFISLNDFDKFSEKLSQKLSKATNSNLNSSRFEEFFRYILKEFLINFGYRFNDPLLKNNILKVLNLSEFEKLVEQSKQEKQSRYIYSKYFLDQLLLELEKEKYGKDPDNFSIFNARNSSNLRYIFESRGIGIKDWAFDVIEGFYSFSTESMIRKDIGLASLLVQLDSDLQLKNIDLVTNIPGDELDLIEFKGERFDIFNNLCRSLQKKSKSALKNVKPITYSLNDHKQLAGKNWRNHFSLVNKLPNLPVRLKTNNRNDKSCNQCHSGYLSNYTGPEFVRNDNSFPLTFMICSNCHSDPNNGVGRFIPFNNQDKFNEFLTKNPGYKTLIPYMLSDTAKDSLKHMPPVLRMNDNQKQLILNYLSE